MKYKELQSIAKKVRDQFPNWSAVQIIDGVLSLYANRHEIYVSRCPGLNIAPLSPEELLFFDVVVPPATSLFDIIALYEHLLPLSLKAEKGITFTPRYIADHIVKSVIGTDANRVQPYRLIDPSCGLGVFLLAALLYLKSLLSKTAWEILQTNIFGLDIEPDNVLVTKQVLLIASCELDSDSMPENVSLNIKCTNSLDSDWSVLFDGLFDGVVGNPPYINPHDLPDGVKEFLKARFSTTQLGTTNIYYAFIEHGMKFVNAHGQLSYIIPNNFITITAARDLRSFLTANTYIARLIDFADNMIFAPVRTYNAIITLDRDLKDSIQYARIEQCNQDCIASSLDQIQYAPVSYANLLDGHRWTLLSPREQNFINIIESKSLPLRQFIKTGIATLRDNAYLVSKDADGSFRKNVGDEEFIIEPEIVRQIYKISDIDISRPIIESVKYIIFPYQKKRDGKHEIIPEENFKQRCPGAYSCLKAQVDDLSKRDKGKPNPVAWYAYGRTQGINFYGKKLIYPTFASWPKFTMVDDEGALFCNGYALFASTIFPIDVLQKILNSSIMKYYVDKTSYPIEGGFMCYQKKYIERFSIPELSHDQIEYIRAEEDRARLDKFILQLYDLPEEMLQQE